MQLKRVFFECKCYAGAYGMARPGMIRGPLNCFCMFFQMQLKLWEVPTVTLGQSDTELIQNIRRWLNTLESPKCNAEQRSFCQQVAERVITEMQEDTNQDRKSVV